MNKNWLWSLLLLILVACDSTKVPITGTRIPVVDYESTLKVDEEAKNISVSLPQPETNTNWPQIGREASHVMSNLAFSGASQPLWVNSIGAGNGAGRLLSPPIIQEGVLYAMDTYGNVSALDISTGMEVWRTDISPQGRETAIIGGGLAYGDGKIFVASPHAEVLALDAKTGAILWRISTLSPVRASPTYADGRLYVLTISNMLSVLEGESGKQLWEHAGITEFAGLLGTATPAVSKGVVIVTYSSGEIYALKADNGYQLWTETLSSTRRPDSLSALSHIRALPVIDGTKVLIIGHNQKMAVYDLRRGERSWERSIGGTRTPAVSGGYIFMLNSHNELVCLTRDFGQVVWIKKLPCDPEQHFKGVWEGPVLAGGQLYLVSIHGDLLSLDPKNGEVIKEQNLGASVSLPPIVAQNTLFILTDNGDVMAFK